MRAKHKGAFKENYFVQKVTRVPLKAKVLMWNGDNAPQFWTISPCRYSWCCPMLFTQKVREVVK